MSELKDYFNRIAQEFNGYYTGQRPTLIQEIAYRVFRGPGLKRRFTDTIRAIGDCEDKEIGDIGCGPGVYAQYFAEHGAKVTAIDISENMIEIAKSNLSEAGIQNVKFIIGDFLEYDSSTSFDHVIAIGFFDYIEKTERDKFLNKMKEITKDKIIITFPKRFVFQTPIRRMLFYLKRQPVFFYTKNMIRSMARSHGLRIRFHNSGPIWTVEFIRNNDTDPN